MAGIADAARYGFRNSQTIGREYNERVYELTRLHADLAYLLDGERYPSLSAAMKAIVPWNMTRGHDGPRWWGLRRRKR